jgi:hypothetical protein
MPVTDAILAALDQAALTYQLRHLATLAYLVAAFLVLRQAAKVRNRADIAIAS